jgi:hypothetical protein
VFHRDNKRVDATVFGLRPGVFIGADQNGRLAEIRPHPDQSAFKVTASILASFRMLGVLFPNTLDYYWRAGAWAYNDGLGGHIHFGRKRPQRPLEVAALDGLGRVLYELGLCPMDEQNRRMQGDAHGQVYGKPTDYRVQLHGYEYRSLPSWLDSAWLTFLCLTCAKLAVFEPALVAPWAQLRTVSVDNLKYLLAYYAGVDDDAALALWRLNRNGTPAWVGGDFKERWGIGRVDTTPYRGINNYPTSLEPSEAELTDLFRHLQAGAALPASAPAATWSPTTIPAGFELMSRVTEFRGQVGIGELLTSIVRWHNVPVQIYPTTHGKAGLVLSSRLERLLDRDWRSRLADVAPGLTVRIEIADDHPQKLRIGIHKKWRMGNRFRVVQRALSSGIFPLWRLKDADASLVERWENRAKVKPNQRKYAGEKLIYPKG